MYSRKRGHALIAARSSYPGPLRLAGRQRVNRYIGSLGINARRRRYRKGGSWGGNSYRITRFQPRSVLVYHGDGYIPEHYYCTHKIGMQWNQISAHTPGSAGYGDFGFYDLRITGNSLYDAEPNRIMNGGRNDATGFAGLGANYDWYKVRRSSIRVTVYNQDTDDPVQVVVIPEISSTQHTWQYQNSLLAQPNSRWITVANQTGKGVVTHSATTMRVHMVNDLDSLNFQGNTTAAPTTLWYWHIIFTNHRQTAAGAGKALVCEALVEVWYDSEWSGLKQAVGST